MTEQLNNNNLVQNYCSFDLQFLFFLQFLIMISDVEHHFLCLLAICIFSLKKCQVLCPVLKILT